MLTRPMKTGRPSDIATKVVAARVPMADYIKFLQEASKHSMSMSDWLLTKIYEEPKKEPEIIVEKKRNRLLLFEIGWNSSGRVLAEDIWEKFFPSIDFEEVWEERLFKGQNVIGGHTFTFQSDPNHGSINIFVH